MPTKKWTRQELLDRIVTAIVATRTHPDANPLQGVLTELEEVAARLKTGEMLTPEYRRTLYFDAVATRVLGDAAEMDKKYLHSLSEIAAAINAADAPAAPNIGDMENGDT